MWNVRDEIHPISLTKLLQTDRPDLVNQGFLIHLPLLNKKCNYLKFYAALAFRDGGRRKMLMRSSKP